MFASAATDAPRTTARRMRKFVMPEKIRPIEQMLELNEDALSPEHLDSQVQKAQEQLLQLKRQQEQIEKQKRELEELSRRQEELERGRADMTDKLTRSLVVLEREAYDTQKKLEQLRATRESFGQHLELIEAIDPKSWNPADLHKELSRALSTVDDARAEFSQQRSRLQAAEEASGDVGLPEAAPDVSEMLEGGRSFGQWVRIGFAFSLPLIIFGLIALLLFFWMVGKVQ
jgi:chromosome segregation ATPase